MNVTALSKAEVVVLQGVARDFLKEIDTQGKPFVRQVVIEAHKAGMQPESLQYLFFTLVERQKDWPLMPPAQSRALSVGRQIMVHEGVVPEYRDGLAIPDEAGEARIDKALERTAFWCQTGMAADLMQGYSRVIRAAATKIRQANPNVPLGHEATYVRAAFENTLTTDPQEFLGSDLMQRVIFVLF